MHELAAQAPLAFAAGVLSVLSPCVMPLMPAYLSLISGISVEEMQDQATRNRRRVMAGCVGFVCGFSTVFVLMGIGAVAVGQVVRSWRAEVLGVEFGIAQIAGLAIVLLGLHMTGLLPIHILYRDTRPQVKAGGRNFVSTYLVGAGFAFGWSPCIGPILGTILTLAGGRETWIQGTALLAVYSAGLAIPFLIAGWSIDSFFRAFQRIKFHFRKIEVASGVMLMAVGVLLMTGQFARLNNQFRFMTDLVSAAERVLQ